MHVNGSLQQKLGENAKVMLQMKNSFVQRLHQHHISNIKYLLSGVLKLHLLSATYLHLNLSFAVREAK